MENGQDASTETLLQQLSQNAAKDFNTVLLSHILKNQITMTKKMDEAIGNNQTFWNAIQGNQGRITSLEQASQSTTADIQTLSGKLSALHGEFSEFSDSFRKLQDENSYLQQWRIDNDLFLSGFPEEPNSTVVAKKLSEIYHFHITEVTYNYSFTMNM